MKWTLYFVDKTKTFYRVSEDHRIVHVLINDEWRDSKYTPNDIIKNQEAYDLGEL